MIPNMPLLAELGSIEKVVITALAVAGGFLVGFLLTNVIARLVCKFVWKKEPPEKVIRIIRFAGGVGAAILVYLLLTGDGGLGLGGRGGDDGNKGKDYSQSAPKKEEPKQDPKKDETKPKDKAIESKAGFVTVYLLSANSPNKRFYRIGQDGQPQTLEEVVQRIGELAKNPKQPVVQIDIEVADLDHPAQAVSVLEVKLNDLGIKSTRPIVKKPSSKN